MASPVINSRKNSSSPPVISNPTVSSVVTTPDTSNKTLDLEEIVSLFVSFILDRTKINDCSYIHYISKLNLQNAIDEKALPIASSKCHIASKSNEKIRKCLADHYLNLTRSKNFILDELITTTTSKDLHYLARKQSTILLLNQAIHQQESFALNNNRNFPVSGNDTAVCSLDENKQRLKLSNIAVNNHNSMTFENTKNNTKSTIKKKNTENLEIEDVDENASSLSKISIDVYLLPDCCYNEVISNNLNRSNLIESGQQIEDCFLLERWSFIMLTKESDEKKSDFKSISSKSFLSINELFQAIKSYLHFSQISSWINLSKSQKPTNIVYRINCSSELEINSKLDQSVKTSIGLVDKDQLRLKEFDFHSFPSVVVNNQHSNCNENSYLTRSKSCMLNQFIQSNCDLNRIFLNTLLRIELYSKKRSNSLSSGILNNSESSLVSVCSRIHLPATLNTSLVFDSMDSKSSETNEKIISSSKSLNPLETNTTSFSSTSTSATRASSKSTSIEDLPQFLDFKSNQTDSIEFLNSSSSSSNSNNNKNFLNNKLPILVSTKNFKMPYSASLQLSNLNDSDCSQTQGEVFEKNNDYHNNHNNENIQNGPDSIQDNNNNNNCAFNLNKYKLTSSNCCSLKPVLNYSVSIKEQKDFGEVLKENINANLNKTNDQVNSTNVNNLENGQPVNSMPNSNIIHSDFCQNKSKASDEITNLPTDHIYSSVPKNIIINNTRANRTNNLPLSSSPAPLRKSGSSLFDFDISLKNPRSIKNALSLNILNNKNNDETNPTDSSYNQDSFLNDFRKKLMSLNPNHLLGNFEESLLNGRMNPVGLVDGFYAVIGASGSFFPEHITLPVNASFYQVSEDIAASPYLGIINLASLGKRGYKVPSKGTIQVTLFNPNNTVVKMFIVMFDLSDMPPGHRTFLRQRTMYVPLKSANDCPNEKKDEHKSYLRYLIHLRFATSKSGKIYLHTNIKLIFARDKCEIDPSLARYEYKTVTEAPQKPKYSPKK